MKRVLIIPATLVGLLIVLIFSVRVYYAVSVNPNVTKELHANPSGKRAELVMLLTFPDGRELPVNYLREGNKVFAGADGRWWREFRAGDVPVKVFIKGQKYSGRASTVMNDPEYTRNVFKRLRPNVPKWLPDWLDAYLVVIELDQ